MAAIGSPAYLFTGIPCIHLLAYGLELSLKLIPLEGAGTDAVHAYLAGYKYHDVVRRRSDREQLKGIECEHCKRFYDAMESWGTFNRPPPCGHIKPGNILIPQG